jgi:Cu/Ag efflux protein CusF
MRLRTRGPLLPLLAALGLLAVAGCESAHRSAPPATTAPATTALVAEEYVEGEATIQAIDPARQTVTLRNDAGVVKTVRVPADTRFKELKVGDRVAIAFYQSITLQRLAPGSAPLGVTQQFGQARSEPGQAPGRVIGEQTTVVVEVRAVNLATNTVTLVGADGVAHDVVVKDPAVQQRLPTLRAGDLVQITYFEAVAAEVVKKA